MMAQRRSSMPTGSLLLPTITTAATSKFSSRTRTASVGARRPAIQGGADSSSSNTLEDLSNKAQELGDKAQELGDTAQNLGDTAQNLGGLATDAWNALQNGISGAQGN